MKNKMLNIRRSFRLRIFLMFIGFIMAVFFANMIGSPYFVQAEMQSQFASKLKQVHLRWQALPAARRTTEQLKVSLEHAIHSDDANDVLLFTRDLPVNDSEKTEFPTAFLDAKNIVTVKFIAPLA